MRIRTGRKNLRNLYLQLGDEPSNDDPCLGLMISKEVAVILSGVVRGEDAALIGDALKREQA
jgi:hypothetical protein